MGFWGNDKYNQCPPNFPLGSFKAKSTCHPAQKSHMGEHFIIKQAGDGRKYDKTVGPPSNRNSSGFSGNTTDYPQVLLVWDKGMKK